MDSGPISIKYCAAGVALQFWVILDERVCA